RWLHALRMESTSAAISTGRCSTTSNGHSGTARPLASWRSNGGRSPATPDRAPHGLGLSPAHACSAPFRSLRDYGPTILSPVSIKRLLDRALVHMLVAVGHLGRAEPFR